MTSWTRWRPAPPAARNGRVWTGTAAAVLLTGLLALSACAAPGDSAKPAPVTGAVVAVGGASVTGLASLDVMDANGAVWHFEAEGFAGMTPAHLEQHRALGEPVRVTYEERDGRLVITMITDG